MESGPAGSICQAALGHCWTKIPPHSVPPAETPHPMLHTTSDGPFVITVDAEQNATKRASGLLLDHSSKRAAPHRTISQSVRLPAGNDQFPRALASGGLPLGRSLCIDTVQPWFHIAAPSTSTAAGGERHSEASGEVGSTMRASRPKELEP